MSKQFPHPFSKLASDYRAMRRVLPKEVSVIATEEFKHNFRIGGYRGMNGVTFWKKRKVNKGSTGRGILIKSGRLRRGIRPAPTYDSARVVNDVPYAKTHNEGFKGYVRVSSFYRRSTRKAKVFSIKTRKSNNVKIAGARTKVKSFRRKMNIEARPFMVTGQPLLNNIDKHIEGKLNQLWDKA